MIVVDTDAMQQTYLHMRELIFELEENMQKIERLVDSVQGEWQGESEKAFMQKLFYVKTQFMRLYMFLEEYVDALEECIEQYELHEQQVYLRLTLI